MPSELTGFDLSKLDLLDTKSRSLPSCFQEVTVAPNRLGVSNVGLGARIGVWPMWFARGHGVCIWPTWNGMNDTY